MSSQSGPGTGQVRGGCNWLVGGMLAVAAVQNFSVAAADRVLPTVELGVDGVYRNGAWTSLRVQPADQQTGCLRAWVEDADGQWVGSPPVSLGPPGESTGSVTFSIRPGRPGAGVRIESLPAEFSFAQPPSPAAAGMVELQAGSGEVSSATPLVLIVGVLPAAAGAMRLVTNDDARRPVVVVLEAATSPLTNWRELDGYEAAIVCGSQVASLSTETLAAIDGWVERGGRLVFAAGDSALGIAVGDSLAAGWLPGSGPRRVPLKRLGAVEAYARAGGLAARVPPAGIEVPRFEAGGSVGVVDAFEGTTAADLPLVIRRAYGLGTITWVGLDIDAPWCGGWPGCDRLVAALLGGRVEQETAAAPEDLSRRVPDLAGQLRIALDCFETTGAASRPVPFEIIALLGILYALALYPLDWWLVSRSGRPWLAWVSLPLLAGGFTALAWGVGGLWGRDAPAQARTAEVLDFDAADGLVRCSTWAAVRSPTNGQLAVAVTTRPGVALHSVDGAVSWFADAGAGFGGVDAVVAHPSLAASDYTYAATLAELRGVPIAAASSRLFEAGWTGQAAAAVASSTLVRDPRGLLVGAVTHHLPFPLEDCWLLHAGWLYDAGRMAGGDTFDPEQGRGPRSLAAALTRRTAKWEADRAERWNTGDTDVGRILQLAGLHAAAGGSGYTLLEAGRLGRLDLSPLLLVDRAILIGRAPAGSRGTAWKLEFGTGQGATSQTGPEPTRNLEAAAADGASLVRIVIPVPTAVGEETP